MLESNRHEVREIEGNCYGVLPFLVLSDPLFVVELLLV
jgi:hypothetical protein